VAGAGGEVGGGADGRACGAEVRAFLKKGDEVLPELVVARIFQQLLAGAWAGKVDLEDVAHGGLRVRPSSS
jgi:hypothetical protein